MSFKCHPTLVEEAITVSNNLVKSGSHRHYGSSSDIIFLVYHVISKDHVIISIVVVEI